MVEIEIDGKKVEVEDGASIIEAADQAGVYIPRFCYHKKLSIAANCRMCLVEVEKAPKALPACATPVTQHMKVMTKSEKTIEAQRAVMQFLLINHPLDCPICDQGGACDLQDTAMGYGSAYSYYDEGKRAVFNDDLGPLIATEMTRCIQCTRCVRYGEEIAGQRELGVVSRGEKERITTYIKHFIQSEVSGNVIDICPVGALTAKPSRYVVRDWEMREHPMVSPHDCVGTNIYMHSGFREYEKQRPVLRTVARENESINESWISDRDRFSYEGLYHGDRIYKPRVKHSGAWEDKNWEPILDELAHHLKTALQDRGSEQLVALASPSATTEEFYMLQKLTRALGSNNVDHRVRDLDFSDQHQFGVFPGLGMAIPDIQELDTIMLVGSDIRREQPMLAHRVYQASQDESVVMAINSIDYDCHFDVTHKIVQLDIVDALAQVAKALADKAGQPIDAINQVTVSDYAKNIAEQLSTSEKAAIFIGNVGMQHLHAAAIRGLCQTIVELSGAQLSLLTDGGNCAGAWLAGAIPHRGAGAQVLSTPGLQAKESLTTKPAKIYLLLNLELENDSAYAEQALKALGQAALVICLSSYVTPAMEDYADFILPITPFTETQGTYVNSVGTWQEFSPCSVPAGDSKPGWKVLRAIASFLDLQGFEYHTITALRDEIKTCVDDAPALQQNFTCEQLPALPEGLCRLAPWPMYRNDPLVRRAEALQGCITEQERSAEINSATAQQLQLHQGDLVKVKQGNGSAILPISINNAVVDHAVIIRSGLEQTSGFGEAMAAVTLEREAQ